MSEGRLREAGQYEGRPSVCRSCGALVGAGESACMMCGAPVVAPRSQSTADDPAARHADPETRRFVRAIVSRPAPFTLVFLTVCLFLFLLMQAAGVDENPAGVLLAYGAKLNQLIDRGEWWRFVTPIFLHGGPGLGWLHLLVNMYALFMLGPYVEKLYGSAKFVFFWVATGVGGTVASYLTVRPGSDATAWGRFLFREVDVPSVGASGALFGLVGVLFVFGIKYRRELPEGFRRAFGVGMLPMIVVNLFIGFTVPVIDNAAHLGGLASGALLALFVGYKRVDSSGPVRFAWRVLQVGSLALVAASFAMVARSFSSPAPVAPFADAMNEGQKVFEKAYEDGDATPVGDAVAKLSAAPALDPDADALRHQLLSLLEREGELLGGPQDAGADERKRRLAELRAEYGDWEARFDEWVRTEGPRFHLFLDETPTPTPAAAQPQPSPG